MPIDIGEGRFHLDVQDGAADGQFELSWTRFYSSSSPAATAAPTPLGSGWFNVHFSRFGWRDGGYEFVDANGAVERFEDPAAELEQGRRLILFAAFLDAWAEPNHYVVRRWDPESADVLLHVFERRPLGEPCRLLGLQDPTGQGVKHSYDAQGRLIAVTQRLEQRSIVLEYEDTGRFIQTVHLRGAGHLLPVARYEHDQAGRLLAAYDPADLPERYAYDANGRMTRIAGRDGSLFRMTYDGLGRCVHSVGLDGFDEKRLKFLDAAGVVELSDSHGATWIYRKRPDGSIVEEIDPVGGATRTDYDAAGRITAVHGPGGGITRYEYDEEGNRSSVINALGERFGLRFTPARLPTEMIDPTGHGWERRYDSDNRLVSTQTPDGATWHYRYDANGCLVEMRDPMGAVQRLQYQDGQLAASTDWQGNLSAYRFDPFGRLVGVVDPLGGATQIEYDVWGNLSLHRSPDGSVRRMQYDATGNLLRYIDSDSSVTRWIYGPCRRLLRKVEPDGSEVRYTWSTEPEELETIVNERGEVYRYVRDRAGRLIEEIGFDGRRTVYRRDTAGEIVSQTNGNGEVTQFSWDALGRLSAKSLPDGSVSRYAYDALGNMVRAANEACDLRFEHDAVGRVIREFQGQHEVEHRYNLAGHRIGIASSLGPRVDFAVDANGDRIGLQAGTESLSIIRNAVGLAVEHRLPNGIVLGQAHDPTGRLVIQNVRRGIPADATGTQRLDVSLLRRRYTYGPTGLLWTLHDDRHGERQITYDARQRPTDVASQGEPVEHYELSPTDDLLRATLSLPAVQRDDHFSYDPGGRLRHRNAETHEFDAQGRLVARYTGSADSPVDAWKYEWNADDLLVSVTRPDGQQWRYTYDALGRRIAKEAAGHAQVAFVWTGNKLLHEVTSGSTTTWLFGDDDLAPLARLDDDGLAAVITDHIGTPVATARRGQLSREALLTARGVEAVPAERPLDMPWRFQGQYADAESGLYYSRFRCYSPDMGAFISQDPLRVAGGFNLYSYATDPINFIDPYGLSTSSDSRQLGKNLDNAGQPKQGKNDDAHHIVMSNSKDKDMKKLQAYMKKNDIDINDPRNGIWLPRKAANRGKDGDTRTAHKGEGLHSQAYKKYVYSKLMAGSPPPPSKREFLARLAAVKKELAQGKTFKCKGG